MQILQLTSKTWLTEQNWEKKGSAFQSSITLTTIMTHPTHCLHMISTHTTSAGEVTYEGGRTKLGTWKAL
jgi:hypothetical protein